MSFDIRRCFVAAVLCLLAFATPSVATPITYQFLVQGFPNNGYIRGAFTGEDLNGDGLLKTFFISPFNSAHEISQMSATYYVNNSPAITSLGGLSALGAYATFNLQTFGLTFSLETYQGPNLGIGNIDHNSVIYWGTQPCPIELTPNPCTQTVMLGGGTQQAPQVWQVPESGKSLTLLAFGLGLPITLKLRSQRTRWRKS